MKHYVKCCVDDCRILMNIDENDNEINALTMMKSIEKQKSIDYEETCAVERPLNLM